MSESTQTILLVLLFTAVLLAVNVLATGVLKTATYIGLIAMLVVTGYLVLERAL